MKEADDAFIRRRVKEELRRRLKGVRAAIPASARAERAARASALCDALPEFASARSIAGYAAIRGELDPSLLLERARARGVLIALPVVDLASNSIILKEDVGAREAGAFGIPEPPADAPKVDRVDLVLVPALAADPRGHRIGWGKGFYDQLLPTLGAAIRVALVYDFQLVSEVPEWPGDERVDFVVTDARVLRVEPS